MLTKSQFLDDISLKLPQGKWQTYFNLHKMDDDGATVITAQSIGSLLEQKSKFTDTSWFDLLISMALTYIQGFTATESITASYHACIFFEKNEMLTSTPELYKLWKSVMWELYSTNEDYRKIYNGGVKNA